MLFTKYFASKRFLNFDTIRHRIKTAGREVSEKFSGIRKYPSKFAHVFVLRNWSVSIINLSSSALIIL